MGIEKGLTNEELSEEMMQKIIEFKRRGETASFGDQSKYANIYVLNPELALEKAKKSLDKFGNLYKNSNKE